MSTLPITLTDGAGFPWDIQTDGSILGGSSDAYDSGMVLQSGFGRYASATTEDSDREIVLGTYTSGSITVVRKVYIPASGTGFARYLEIVSNTGSTATTYNLQVGTNLGSDGATTVVSTSSGDTSLTMADRYSITDDTDASGDPTLVHLSCIDVSGSMASSFQGSTGGDLNGDGSSDTLLDGAIASSEALTTSLISSDLGASRIALVAFDSSAGTDSNGTVSADANANGRLDCGP
jgi:hypothetical protein